MEEEEVNSSISCLPNEIITIILQCNDVQDILSFGSTCKRFWELIQNNEILWKSKFKSIIPANIFDSVDKHCEGQWLKSFIDFNKLRKLIHTEIIAMSPKFYWQCYDVTLEDVRNFFDIALSNNFNYFYVIYILQELIKTGNAYIENKKVQKPYTLTEMFYAKVVLRHLIHTFLAVMWVKSRMRNELLPEIVVNFFLQWIDNVNLHPDFEVEDIINELVNKVKVILNAQNPKLAAISVQERCAKKLTSKRQVLKAVTEVLYHQRHMAVTAAANLETLDISKVFTNRLGNATVVCAVYHSVARRCGVQLKLVAFPNHLYLEWEDDEAARPQIYTVDLATGELRPKHRCPFSHTSPTSYHYNYSPENLLQYIYTSFHLTMGALKNWNTQNAFHLLDFMAASQKHSNPYRNFFTYLGDNIHLPAMNMSLDLTYLEDAQIQIIRSLANLNVAARPVAKEFVVKRHASHVKYGVGMLCYHTKFDYVGIVLGWDLACDPKWADRLETEINLEFGMNQPFYYIIAADQSDRYVAQDLVELARPTRLYHLEDSVARDFTHFDGFSYVPNAEKMSEYPDEEPVVTQYQTRSHYRR